MNLILLQINNDLSGLVNTMIIQIFAQNYITFLLTVILGITILLFAYRFTGPESIIVANILIGALFMSQINPLFTSLFVAVGIVDGILIVLPIWKNFAQV